VATMKRRLLAHSRLIVLCACLATMAGLALALFCFREPIHIVHMFVLQERADNNLPKGSSYEQVEQWCILNDFKPPHAQIFGVAKDCPRMTAWRKDSYDGKSYFAIDFYFDSNKRLLRLFAFRGDGFNDDGTQ
jgi:hypothetical protein